MERNDRSRCQRLNRNGSQDKGRKWAERGEERAPHGRKGFSMPTWRVIDTRPRAEDEGAEPQVICGLCTDQMIHHELETEDSFVCS